MLESGYHESIVRDNLHIGRLAEVSCGVYKEDIWLPGSAIGELCVMPSLLISYSSSLHGLGFGKIIATMFNG